MIEVTEGLRAECAAEWDYLLNKTFSTPMAIEHLAQFVVSHRTTAEADQRERDAGIAERHFVGIGNAYEAAGNRIATAIRGAK